MKKSIRSFDTAPEVPEEINRAAFALIPPEEKHEGTKQYDLIEDDPEDRLDTMKEETVMMEVDHSLIMSDSSSVENTEAFFIDRRGDAEILTYGSIYKGDVPVYHKSTDLKDKFKSTDEQRVRSETNGS